MLSAPILSLDGGLVGDMSLMPRLWPAPVGGNAPEPWEDIVLVRLGVKELVDAAEYAEELVEALDAVYRSGLDLPGR